MSERNFGLFMAKLLRGPRNNWEKNNKYNKRIV